jgi:uncharacterized membrane protein
MNEAFQPYNYEVSNGSSLTSARRFVPVIAGTAIALFGLSQRSKSGLALAAAGGALAYVGARGKQQHEPLIAEGSVLINCAREEAYKRYRRFEELPTFMNHLESVEKIGDKQYRWTAVGPMGLRISWNTEIVDEREGEFVAWRSLPGSDLAVEGSVRFETAPGDRGTILAAVTRYDPPAGKLGRSIAKLFGKDPKFLMQQDLRRFRAVLETGEIPTTAGQTHGSRSRVLAAVRLANPDRPTKRDAQMSEIHNENRRLA